MFSPADYLGKSLDEKFNKLKLRQYAIRYEGQKDSLLSSPIEIVPTPHISDLGVDRLDRPGFSADIRRTRKEADFYNIRQYSVKFNKSVMMALAEQLNIDYYSLFTRNARYGLAKRNEFIWNVFKPLSEDIESFGSSDFVSVILQPEKGVY